MAAPAIWTHRELLLRFVERAIEVRHKGSHLGLAWAFVQPLLLLGLYVFVFGIVFGGSFNQGTPEPRLTYALGIFVGLACFHFLAEVVTLAPSAILAQPNFVKKVVFPLEILPAAVTGAAAFHFLITLGFALAGLLLLGPGPHLGLLWFPLLLAPLIILAHGLALLLSALGVFWRDIGPMVGFLTTALMFASAVFYPVHRIPAAARPLLELNPLLQAIDLSRAAALWGQAPSASGLAILWGWALATLLAGAFTFRRLRPAFADVL